MDTDKLIDDIISRLNAEPDFKSFDFKKGTALKPEGASYYICLVENSDNSFLYELSIKKQRLDEAENVLKENIRQIYEKIIEDAAISPQKCNEIKLTDKSDVLILQAVVTFFRDKPPVYDLRKNY